MKLRAPSHPLVSAKVAQMRRMGHRGSVILPHRAIGQLHSPAARLAVGLAMAMLFTLALLALQGPIASGWSTVLVGWLQALDLQGLSVGAAAPTEGWLSLSVPMIELPLLPPTNELLLLQAGLIVVCWWLAGLLPDAAKPGAYLLRFAALIHGLSLAYFALWPASFLHSLPEHTINGLRQTWALMLLTPWIHVATYYLFPFPLRHGLALTLLTLAYLLVLTPLQYALHAALLYHLGLVFMPLLYLLFGAMLSILGFVALYGWAMSWTADAADEAEAQ